MTILDGNGDRFVRVIPAGKDTLTLTVDFTALRAVHGESAALSDAVKASMTGLPWTCGDVTLDVQKSGDRRLFWRGPGVDSWGYPRGFVIKGFDNPDGMMMGNGNAVRVDLETCSALIVRDAPGEFHVQHPSHITTRSCLRISNLERITYPKRGKVEALPPAPGRSPEYQGETWCREEAGGFEFGVENRATGKRTLVAVPAGGAMQTPLASDRE